MAWITLNNSPFYLAGLLVLLLIVLVLKKPSKRWMSSYKKWSVKRREERKKKKHKSIIPLVMNKDKKVGKGRGANVKKVTKKVFINDWSTPLFFIVGAGILIYALFSYIDYLAISFNQIYEFIFDFVNHNNLTTIILAVFMASIFVIISDLFEYLQRSKYGGIRILSMILFTILISLSLIVFIRAIELSGMSNLNASIFAIVFVLMGLLINYKRIFRRREPKEKEEVKEETEKFIF